MGTEFAVLNGMLIVRCAWHSRYHGYARLLGVASWRGLRVEFTDGLCPSCAKRVREEELGRDRPPSRWPGPGRAAALFVGVPLSAALVLTAAPLSAPPAPPARSALRPAVPAVAALPARALPSAVPRPDAGVRATPRVPERVPLRDVATTECDTASRAPARARWIPTTATADKAAATSAAIWIPADAPRTWVAHTRPRVAARDGSVQTP